MACELDFLEGNICQPLHYDSEGELGLLISPALAKKRRRLLRHLTSVKNFINTCVQFKVAMGCCFFVELLPVFSTGRSPLTLLRRTMNAS
jgi:hypothetical protein